MGEFVSEADYITTVWPDPADDSESVEHAVRHSIHFAAKRSISSDSSFGIRQLMDIALRAMSPGVNDPTTAVDVLHHLKIPIREVLVSDPPRRVFKGRPEGVPGMARKSGLPEADLRRVIGDELLSEDEHPSDEKDVGEKGD